MKTKSLYLDIEVSFMGSLISPQVLVKGMGTVGYWDNNWKCFVAYKDCAKSSYAYLIPDKIECPKEQLLDRIKALVQMAVKNNTSDANKGRSKG
jgi:hypothetical protein